MKIQNMSIKDCYTFAWIITAVILQLLGCAGGLCNHTVALQCLQTAEQQFQMAITNDFAEFCRNQRDNLDLKRCLGSSTGTCDKATQDMFLIQAARFLRPIETQCSYLISQNEHQKTTSTAKASSTCRRAALPFCYRDLVTRFDTSNDIKKAFTLTNPLVEWQFNQEDVCSKLVDVDLDKILDCIEKTGCQNERVFTEKDANQYILYSTVFDLIKGICQPECDYIASRIQNANACLRQDNIISYLTETSQYQPMQPSCSDLSKAFQCVQLNIEFCKAGSDYLYILYNIISINPDIYRCPDLDTSFYISEGSTLSHLDGSYTAVLVLSLYISLVTTLQLVR